MAKDIFHNTLRTALEKDGWLITHDPLTINLSKRRIFIDLGAEKLLFADKDHIKIAVEVKSFLGLSILNDFYKALGQYQLYLLALKHQYPDRILYLAIPIESYQLLISDELLADFLQELSINWIVYHPNKTNIISWINEPTIKK